MNRIITMAMLAVFTVSTALLTTACGKASYNSGTVKIDPYYITGSRETKKHFQDLFVLLARDDNSTESTFVVLREIANSFAKAKEYGRLIHFLNKRVMNFPDDPYNSYYLLMIAYAYMQKDSLPVAARYFDLIIKNYPDLTVNGESIHFACLNQLIDLTENPEQQAWYYEELISRFSGRIDLGVTWFMLAQACERIGDWNRAMQAYTCYLPFAGSIISGFPDADNYARQQVDFNNSRKDWTYESLSALVAAIEEALDSGSSRQIERHMAKVNFFAHSWEPGETDNFSMAEFNLYDFLRGNHIRYENKLDASSNATEAFLKTWGWGGSRYVSTWYLYFRKIHFPSDPEIHGRWEWAGIYYGEKF